MRRRALVATSVAALGLVGLGLGGCATRTVAAPCVSHPVPADAIYVKVNYYYGYWLTADARYPEVVGFVEYGLYTGAGPTTPPLGPAWDTVACALSHAVSEPGIGAD